MKKRYETRYIMTDGVSIEVTRWFRKSDAYQWALKPGYGAVNWHSARDGYKNPQIIWDPTDKTQVLVCEEDCGVDIYTKDGRELYFTPGDEISSKVKPKQADVEAIIADDGYGIYFWTESAIRIFVTYDENGLIDEYRLSYGDHDEPLEGETEITFEDLYFCEDETSLKEYRENLPGTVEYQDKQEAAEAQSTGDAEAVQTDAVEDGIPSTAVDTTPASSEKEEAEDTRGGSKMTMIIRKNVTLVEAIEEMINHGVKTLCGLGYNDAADISIYLDHVKDLHETAVEYAAKGIDHWQYMLNHEHDNELININGHLCIVTNYNTFKMPTYGDFSTEKEMNDAYQEYENRRMAADIARQKVASNPELPYEVWYAIALNEVRDEMTRLDREFNALFPENSSTETACDAKASQPVQEAAKSGPEAVTEPQGTGGAKASQAAQEADQSEWETVVENQQDAGTEAETSRPAWMNDWQYEDFQQACALIDTIKTEKDFYRVIDIVNDRFSLDVINAAREYKQCYNSGQYEQPQEWAEAASEGRRTDLGTPDMTAGTDTTTATDNQQDAPKGTQRDSAEAVERGTGRQPGGP